MRAENTFNCVTIAMIPEVNISTFPDHKKRLLHLRYQHNEFQTGVSLGSFIPIFDERTFTASADIFYNFAESFHFSEHRLWNVRGGLHYFCFETTEVIERNLYFNTRIGNGY